MGRHNGRRRDGRRRDAPAETGEGDGDARFGRSGARRESGSDGDWLVRTVAGAKTYRCPGCSQQIGPGSPHVVAWPDVVSGLVSRRHWHTACWREREQRRPPVERGRDAPRH